MVPSVVADPLAFEIEGRRGVIGGYLAATACSMWRAENNEDGNYVCAIAT
jgi:hypothetical protein